MDPQFVLNGSTLTGIGAVLGALNGAIVWLTRQLLGAKDAEIARMEKQIAELQTQNQFLRDIVLRYMIDPSILPVPHMTIEEQRRDH